MKIALISDLHVGDGARSNDLKPAASLTEGENGFLDRFEDFCKDADIYADYLVVTGDVTNRASDEEIQHASHVITHVAECMKVDKENVIYVPGNHDVNWRVIGEDDSGWSDRYAGFSDANLLFQTIDSASSGEIYDSNYFDIVEKGNAIFVRYNSAHGDGPNKKVHNGEFDIACLPALQSEMDRVKDNKIKVFITHHHPYMYPNLFPGVDYSAMQNAEALLDFLVRNEFDLLLHGHRHVPQFKSEIRGSGKSLLVIGGGSFCAKLGDYLSESSNNQFHLISIDGVNEQEEVKGDLYSWSYTFAHGWLDSSSTGRLNCCKRFGSSLHGKRAKQYLRDSVSERIKNGEIVYWSEIESGDDEIKYLDHDFVVEVLTKYAEEVSYRFMNSTDDGIVMIPFAR